MKYHLLLICAAGLVLSSCVSPEDYQILENRVTVLENENRRRIETQDALQDKGASLGSDIKTLKENLSRNTGLGRENTAEIKYEIQQLKEKIQHTEGLIEELNYRYGSTRRTGRADVDKDLTRLDDAISRNYEKILRLEKYMGFEPSGPGGGDTSAKGKKGKVEPEKMSEPRLYAYAKSLYDKGDMENARIHFENFINKYSDSKNADNARFWIADSYYVEKWYEKAILEYQTVLEKYPRSNKTAAARLKQGYAFIELGEKANARLILNELIKRHPKSNEARYAREKLKNLK